MPERLSHQSSFCSEVTKIMGFLISLPCLSICSHKKKSPYFLSFPSFPASAYPGGILFSNLLLASSINSFLSDSEKGSPKQLLSPNNSKIFSRTLSDSVLFYMHHPIQLYQASLKYQFCIYQAPTHQLIS